ncbi:putative DUF4376 domain-containing protein [Vibrio phage 501E54-1]|nr:putative DUF4376 domain-containing protein [Vibrio phage 501E54-1]
MNKIDTEYPSLSQVDSEIARFYEEETRTRVIGHTEPDEEGNSTPITEEYVVVVLNRPDEVSFKYVESRRSRRLGEGVTKAALVEAITWNDFAVNHDGYLEWVEDFKEWEKEHPTSVHTMEGVEEVVVPVKPVIDIADQRTVYEIVEQSYNSSLFNKEGYTVTYNDELFTKTLIPTLAPKSIEEVVEYYSQLAISTRYEAIYAPLLVGNHLIDIGKGKDGVLGIDNVKDALSGYDAGITDITSVDWIMKDNQLVSLDLKDLQKIVVDFNVRKQKIFTEYSEWRLTDQTTPYVPSGN